MSSEPASAPLRLTGRQWLICAIAALGFLFDTYELLMLPLIVRPALAELVGAAPGSPEFSRWAALLFYVPAVCGGLFGMLGGYLTDWFGRRRVLVWSILLYAASAFAAGFATSPQMLLVLRCTTFVGVCVEFVAGIAWLAELFPEPRLREKVLGITQAFASVGGLMVSAAYKLLAGSLAPSLPAIAGGHQPWRYALISGLIPALPLILVRPWLPESPIWREKKAAGTLARPSFAEIFTPRLRRTTLVAAVLSAVGFAFAFGAIQQGPSIVTGLDGVKDLPRPAQEAVRGSLQFTQEIGGLVGRVLLAVLAIYVVSRRKLLGFFLLPATVVVPLVFYLAPQHGPSFLSIGVFFGALLVVGQFSFWGNYLPRVYPTHLRGTGESFAVNVGGRMLGTSAGAATVLMITKVAGANPTVSYAHAAALIALVAGVIGVLALRWLPEPDPDERTT